MINKKQIIVFSEKKEIINAAEEQANKVDPDFESATYFYYIARYFVSVFESRYGVIPVQVWNEYRNALDHFFRHLTNNQFKQASDAKNQVGSQLHKMEGHLQRAALDIMKIYCHKTKDSVAEIKASYKPGVIQLVDNGKFHSYLITETSCAEGLFEKAKIYDNNLGETADQDREVINKYLDAVFVFDALKVKLIDKAPDIEAANNSYKSIHDNASKGSTWHHYLIHFTFYIFWTILVFVCTLIWDEQLNPIYQNGISVLLEDDNSSQNKTGNLKSIKDKVVQEIEEKE